MNATLFASKHLRFLKSDSGTIALYLRHVCSEAAVLLPQNDYAIVSQAVQLLQAPDTEWDTAQLNHLLFSKDVSSSSSNPRLLMHVARRLPTSSHALKFLEYLQNGTPSPPGTESLSFTFQAIFELASRESDASLSVLLETSKERSIPLTVNAITLLLRCFGRRRMVEEALSLFKDLTPSTKNTHVGNVLLGVLFKCGRVDDALQVVDEMLRSNDESDFSPNDDTGSIIFSSLLRKDRSRRVVGDEVVFDLVLKLGKHGVFPSPIHMTQLITRLCRNGEINRAWDILHELMKLGAVLDAPPWNALLSGLGREGNFKRMNEAMAKMKEADIQPNVVTFGVIVNYMCKFRQVDLALEVLQKMCEGTESDGVSVEPDAIIYNTLIHGLCNVGRQEEGLRLMERMRTQKGCAPTTSTYNCLIDGFCKAGELDTAKELLKEMQKGGLEPNLITVNTMINGMCRNGRINSAVEFLNEMQRKGLRGNSVTYTVLITAFCGVNNIEKAKEYFDEMLKVGCTPDAIVYYSLISGFTQAGRMDDASFVLSKLKEAGFRPDRVCYNVLIGGFCRKNKKDRAYELLKEMEESGLKPDSVTYNTVISYFSKIGDLLSAHRAMTEMIRDGITPTVITYGAIIHAYCSNGKVEDAMKIFEDMKAASNIPPNTVIYNILIDSLCKNNNVKRALSLIDDMAVVGVRPNTATYNAMLKGLREERWSAEAFKLMDKMIEHACNPDYITMEILTEWLPVIGQTERLQNFVRGYEASSLIASNASANKGNDFSYSHHSTSLKNRCT